MAQREREDYKRLVERRTPGSHIARDTWRAAWVGGAICALSEAYVRLIMARWALERTDAGAVCSVTLVAITALLTALGVFDRIGRYAGGGTIVPITGFAFSRPTAKSTLTSLRRSFATSTPRPRSSSSAAVLSSFSTTARQAARR